MEKQDDISLLELSATYDYKIWPLPNIVQLVESELPVQEADNHVLLAGMFLFRQVYSPYDQYLRCVFCCDKYSAKGVSDLQNHYDIIHDLEVYTARAHFNKSTVFICVPSNVNEYTTVNTVCRFCDATIKNLAGARNHFSTAHEKTVKILPESEVIEISNYFYCSLCKQASSDFQSHQLHMKIVHKLQSCVCKHCKFCTSLPVQHRTRVQELHHCPVCPEDLKGRDCVIKHIKLSHAIQIGPKAWSCAKCFRRCRDPPDLITHVISCSKRSVDFKSRSKLSAAACNEFYRCWIYSMAFSLEEIKRNENETAYLYIEAENEEAVSDEENNYVHSRCVDEIDANCLEAKHPVMESLIDDITEQMVAMDLTQTEEKQIDKDESRNDSAAEQQTQLICGFCWSTFNSLDKFVSHICLEQPDYTDSLKEDLQERPQELTDCITVGTEKWNDAVISIYLPEMAEENNAKHKGYEQTELAKESKQDSVPEEQFLMICGQCFDIFKSPDKFVVHTCQQQNSSGLGQSDLMNAQDYFDSIQYMRTALGENVEEDLPEFADCISAGTEKLMENDTSHEFYLSQYDV